MFTGRKANLPELPEVCDQHHVGINVTRKLSQVDQWMIKNSPL